MIIVIKRVIARDNLWICGETMIMIILILFKSLAKMRQDDNLNEKTDLLINLFRSIFDKIFY